MALVGEIRRHERTGGALAAGGLREPVMMPSRRRLLSGAARGLLAGLLVGLPAIGAGLVLPGGAAAAASDTDAQRFIEGLADEAIAALTPSELSRGEREARARRLLVENFAVPTIGQFVLGRYWRTATAEERAEYLELFQALIVDTYVDRFSRYSGEKLKVTRSVTDTDSGDIVVYSEISRPAGQPIEIGWRVRGVGNGFKVVDVLVEGVSMGQTQRSEFSSVIRNSGGTVAGLLAEMRRRTGQPT